MKITIFLIVAMWTCIGVLKLLNRIEIKAERKGYERAVDATYKFIECTGQKPTDKWVRENWNLINASEMPCQFFKNYADSCVKENPCVDEIQGDMTWGQK